VPDSSIDRSLEQLLEYGDAPQADAFVAEVMTRVSRERRTRKVILFVFGLIGALFGIAGAVMLAGPISRLFTFTLELPVMETMQLVLAIIGAIAFYIWFMNDDLSLSN
jgi:uncharacterized membrane protein YeaQ/YmgE (transglycosylase-associated protein family)